MEMFSRDTITDLRQEHMLSSQCCHPNLLRHYVSFVDGSELWIVMPLFEAGNLEDLMQSSYRFRDGIRREKVIAAILN